MLDGLRRQRFNSTTSGRTRRRKSSTLERRPQFNFQWAQYTSSMGIFTNNYAWAEAKTALPSLWWVSNSCEVATSP